MNEVNATPGTENNFGANEMSVSAVSGATELPLDLQRFADDTPADVSGADANASVQEPLGGAAGAAAPPEEPAESEGDKTPSGDETVPAPLTADAVKKLVDDALAGALAAAAEKQSEAEKLAKMSKEEREEHERKTREDDYQKRLADVTRRELRIEAHKALKEKNLPVELLDALRYDDAEACKESLKAVEMAFRAAVEAGVNDRLRGKPPGTSNAPGSLTVEAIAEMSQEEIAENIDEVMKALEYEGK